MSITTINGMPITTGARFALPFSAAAVQRAGVHHLKLEP